MNLEKEYWENRYNDKVYIRSVIEAGPSYITQTDENGQTLLHKTQNPECLQMLVGTGLIDVNTKDNNGNTPLHLLSRYPNKLTSDPLVAQIYFDAAQIDDFFALWAKCGEILIEAHANVNVKNNAKEAPLFGCFNPMMVDLLLKEGANPLAGLSRDDMFGQITARDFIEIRCWEEREKFVDDTLLDNAVARISRIERSLKKAEKDWRNGCMLEKAQKSEDALRRITVYNKQIPIYDESKVKE